MLDHDLTRARIYRARAWERRLTALSGQSPECGEGCFVVPSPVDKKDLRVIATVNNGWDHLSVSRSDRCPTWEEMDFIKRMFFKPTEVAMQYHPEEANHVNVHEYCLHLWRPQKVRIPRPPKEFV